MLVTTDPLPPEPVPHEPGHWMAFRKLPWKVLKQARKRQEAEAREVTKELGVEFLRALTQGTDDDVEKVRAKLEARRWDVDQFDLETLLRHGIAEWSYPGATTDGIDQLDEDTARWAGTRIIASSRPRTEAETKNDSPSSTPS